MIFSFGFLDVLVDLIDIVLVTWVFHRVYQYFKDTRAGQMLVGLLILLISSFIFNSFGLSAMSWLVNQFQTVWVVALLYYFSRDSSIINLYWQTRFFQNIQDGNIKILRGYRRRISKVSY